MCVMLVSTLLILFGLTTTNAMLEPEASLTIQPYIYYNSVADRTNITIANTEDVTYSIWNGVFTVHIGIITSNRENNKQCRVQNCR